MPRSNPELDSLRDKIAKISTMAPPRFQRQLTNFFRTLEANDIRSVTELLNRFSALTSTHQENAIWVLGRSGKKKAVPFLLKLLRAKKHNCWETAIALVLLGGRRAIRGLLDFLDEDQDENSREAVVYSLNFAFDPKVAEKLITLAGDEKEPTQIRAHAIEGLGYVLPELDKRTSPYKRGQKCVHALVKDNQTKISSAALFSYGNLQRGRT